MSDRLRALGARLGRGGGMWGEVGRTAVVKFGVMGFAALFSIWTQNLIITRFGAQAYDQYALIATFPALLPFADLGLGAVIFNTVAAADDPARSTQVQRAIMTAVRILTVSALVFGLVGIALLVTGLWPVLLGSGLMPGGEVTATLCLLVFAAGLPLAVGQRIIVGLGRSSVQVAAQGVVAPLMLLAVVLLMWSGVDPAGQTLSIWSFLANSTVSVICLVLAWKWTSPALKEALRDVPRLRSVRGAKVRDIVGPNLVISILTPMALQVDRLLLSHWGSPGELGVYHLSNTFFQMLSQTVMVASIAMWPVFAKARARGEVRSPMRATVVFAGLALAGGTVLALFVPWATDLVSDGALRAGWALCAAFVVYIAVDAAKYPLSMYMTDARGLRFQIIPISLLIPAKIGLAWLLIPRLGAAGPLVASAIAVVLCQFVPYSLYVRAELRRRRADAADAAEARQDAGGRAVADLTDPAGTDPAQGPTPPAHPDRPDKDES